MYTTVYAKIWINMDKHGKAMSNIGLEQGCPLSPTLFGLYIDEIVILCVYLMQWLPFFSLSMMLLCCIKSMIMLIKTSK